MAYTKAELEALKTSLIASAQVTKITGVKHRQMIQAMIDEAFDAQTRANLLKDVQTSAAAQDGDVFLVIRAGAAHLVPFVPPSLTLASVDTSGLSFSLDFGGEAEMAFKGSVNVGGNKSVLIINDTDAKQVRFFKFSATAGIQLTFEADVRHSSFDGAWDSETGVIWTAPADGNYILKAHKADSLWFVEPVIGPFVDP